MLFYILGILNSKSGSKIAKVLNPTIITQSGDLEKFPLNTKYLTKDFNLLNQMSLNSVHSKRYLEYFNLKYFYYKMPNQWENRIDKHILLENQLTNNQYNLDYAISVGGQVNSPVMGSS